VESITLQGGLSERDTWRATSCSIAKALEVVGTRSAMLIMREAYYGAHRFEEFVRRVEITEAVAATRLRELTAAGLLSRVPYQDPGQRTRHEYHLTQMGADLLPALLALMQWGDRYLAEQPGGPLNVTHVGCGEPVTVDVRCAAGHEVDLGGLGVQVSRTRKTPASASPRAAR
jgi:DNA-binding HxlR family transcriptional regulator